MTIRSSNVASTIVELSNFIGSTITAASKSRNAGAFNQLIKARELPRGWRPADEAFGKSKEFTGRVFTNEKVSINGSVKIAETLIFGLFETPKKVTIDALISAVHCEVGYGHITHPKVSCAGRSVLLEGSYVSEGIPLYTLTRYHLNADCKELSQITVTTALPSKVDSVTRNWLASLDAPRDAESEN
jgi:hypothetical protein